MRARCRRGIGVSDSIARDEVVLHVSEGGGLRRDVVGRPLYAFVLRDNAMDWTPSEKCVETATIPSEKCENEDSVLSNSAAHAWIG